MIKNEPIRSVTVYLSDKEDDVLTAIAVEKHMTKENIMRQALRMYQTIEIRLARGEKLFHNDPVMGCGGED